MYFRALIKSSTTFKGLFWIKSALIFESIDRATCGDPQTLDEDPKCNILCLKEISDKHLPLSEGLDLLMEYVH